MTERKEKYSPYTKVEGLSNIHKMIDLLDLLGIEYNWVYEGRGENEIGAYGIHSCETVLTPDEIFNQLIESGFIDGYIDPVYITPSSKLRSSIKMAWYGRLYDHANMSKIDLRTVGISHDIGCPFECNRSVECANSEVILGNFENPPQYVCQCFELCQSPQTQMKVSV